MKTIKFTVKTPKGKNKTVTVSGESYWTEKTAVEEEHGEILDQELIKIT